MSEELKKAFGKMNTDMLEELLQSNLHAEEPSLDDDTVLVILEILEERAKENGEPVADANAMWNRFCADYLPDAENGSLYGEDISETEEKASASSKRRRFGGWLRAASIVLAAGLVIGAVSLTASAAGYNLWGAVAQWSKDAFVFSFESPEPEPSEQVGSETYASLQEALDAYDITEQLVPTSVPDRYELDNINVSESDEYTVFVAVYHNQNEDSLLISVVQRLGIIEGVSHEKDESEVEIYTVDGIDHYLMTNLFQEKAVWVNNNFEVFVAGKITREELKRMIDSIY